MSGEKYFENLLQSYGPMGVFIISALGNAIPYSTIPYLLLIVVYAGTLDDLTSQVIVAVAGGFGAAFGKIIVYYFGRGLRLILTEEQKRNLEVFVDLFKKSTFLAVFIFAALPLPDDILYIPLGASGYSVIRYFIALVLGKIVITGTAVFFGSTFSWILESSTEAPWYITYPSLLAVTLILTYIVAKIDWVGVAREYKKKGVLMGTIALIKETYRALIALITWPLRRITRRT